MFGKVEGPNLKMVKSLEKVVARIAANLQARISALQVKRLKKRKIGFYVFLKNRGLFQFFGVFQGEEERGWELVGRIGVAPRVLLPSIIKKSFQEPPLG